jgi:hypothetical protein
MFRKPYVFQSSGDGRKTYILLGILEGVKLNPRHITTDIYMPGAYIAFVS